MFDVVGKAIEKVVEVILGLPKLIIDGIVDFFRDPIGSIVDGVKAVLDFFGGLIDALINMFKSIFIPSDGYFDRKVRALQSSLNRKVDVESYKQALNGMTNADTVAIRSQRISLFGTSFEVDIWGTINKYKEQFQWIIRAVAFWALLQYNINNVYKLIRGDSLDDGGGD